ncbi:MAG: hypothetical protein EYC62_06705 [Alphaproteobacteria bacterium]|nr:MAG: hypothetical protein EYC62_06705 [Alphaproteobacteria bacterium]
MRRIFHIVLVLSLFVATSALAADTKPIAEKAPAVKTTAHKAEKSTKSATATKAETVKKPEEVAKDADKADKNVPSAPQQAVEAAKEKPKTAKSTASAGANGDLITVISGRNDLKTMSNLLQASGLADELKTGGPFTILAPTDSAFAKLPQDKLLEWLKPKNKAELRNVVGHHLVPGKLALSDYAGKQITQNTVQGGTVDIGSREGGDIFINKAKITASEIPAANGIILVIDGVLEPNSSAIVESPSVM